MAAQLVFKRYEMKYMLSLEQKAKLLAAMEPYMKLDKYGRTSIRNLYYDTDSYLLIRRSIEKPKYKEKLRVRSYGRANPDSTVFVELKKKYNSVVYKRRIAMEEKQAMEWLNIREGGMKEPGQISAEVEYFLEYYKDLHPVVFLSYEREAYYMRDKSDLRVTFDDSILVRQENLTLESEPYGIPILPEGMVLMELKCSGGLPLWLTELLSKEKIYKTSFSKYGTAYKNIIYPKLGGLKTC